MAAVVRHLSQGIVHSSRLFSKTLFTRLFSRLSPPHRTPQPPSPFRPAHPSIHARFSLPVKYALSRPFSPPRLPKPPVVPANVTQLGLGTARAFHSGRPVFQNLVDNVPIATRALWEAEWDVKMKKKEARRFRRATRNIPVSKSRQILKPATPIAEPDPSELDVYFPVEPVPPATTHLLVPLAPTPSARLPLSCHSDGPLLPISHLAHIHTSHHLHSLRVSTLFARLDTANVWDDPGVNVDAYAFGPRHDTLEKQCTVLRVSFRGWTAARVCAILGDTTGDWYSLQETLTDGHPSLAPLHNSSQQTISPRPELPPLESLEAVSSEVSIDDESHLLSALPIRANASAQHDLVLPTLDLPSALSDAAHNLSLPPQPIMCLRTASELTRDAELLPSTLFSAHSSPTHVSRDCLGFSSSFLNHVEENNRGHVAKDL